MACGMHWSTVMKYRGAPILAGLAAATAICGFFSNAAWADTTPDGVVATPKRSAGPPLDDRAHPRLKLSAIGFSIDNLDGSAVSLKGVHLDAYPLSERWMRGGINVEGGKGNASVIGSSFNVTYGLVGLSAGVQYPGRFTPFIEGHMSGGVLSGRQEGQLTVGTTTVSGAWGTTWLYARGIDVGSEFYFADRFYLSLALGWTRATWGAPDFTARVANPQAQLRLVNLTSDSLLWKLGIGF